MVFSPSPPPPELGAQVRRRFVDVLVQGLPALAEGCETQLLALASQTGTARDMQMHRDAWLGWQQHRKAFVEGLQAAWLKALHPPGSAAPRAEPLDMMNLQLVGDDVLDNQITASRMAQALSDRVGAGFQELRGKLQELPRGGDLSADDVLRPETLCQHLIEQWVASGLNREVLLLLSERLKESLAPQIQEAYRQANQWLQQRGVVASDDLRSRVKRAPASPGVMDAGASGAVPVSANAELSGRPGASGDGSARMQAARATGDETQLLSGSSPLMRARARAHGLIGQLQRLLVRSVGDVPAVAALSSQGFSLGSVEAGGGAGLAQGLMAVRGSAPASEALAQALTPMLTTGASMGGIGQRMAAVQNLFMMEATPAGVAAAAGALRDKSAELKKKTANPAEKATIEIVALMFQSILSEERLPPAIRVWFARLQVPVLRVALAEPEFFDNLSHPARLLIDRMGSCVLGFDDNAIADSALEAEIRRVVQVIEQYPETGRRVFQLVHDEFQKFLNRFLTEKGKTARLVTVAQQVEQKEALAIQYTIEMRNMLKDMPVRDEIRDFLFKVWSEVLALSAVRSGPQHESTVAFKKAAADLVWAASAKPNRSDRARVIHDLPMLLQHLRKGLAMLGVTGAPQEAHIKILSETLADAFLSKTEAIPQATIDAMAKRLTHLEDYVTEEGLDELPLDAESLEVMLGVDGAALTVVAGGGTQPSEDMLAWALELQTGLWFSLDHNGSVKQVQYAWRSDRRQLHLFAAMDGTSYLIQLRRLAAYLQAGLMVPQEEETLTLRATRDALAKLDANPERLLN
ncbi:MAG: DUF1631 domain-containing protein [Curvibacter lanceolatus]|jgi:uncharacterized coiled-coil protein SlyX|uniref:DUF1631 domain-containing protein n=1 Tax=Curvibacter lanceolatus TaxID=86182 RepID=UPI0003636D24|nr:DUF1631 domain-containing protein [Curvibacter lanceolatus]MBV5294746.1 DUF1631 domain-containing protein [Curvibacter lanceolatus]